VDIDRALEWLQTTPIPTAIGENEILFPWIESVHVLAIVLVVGTISIVDLRLLGVASRGLAVRSVMREVIPYTWGAFVLAALTGSVGLRKIADADGRKSGGGHLAHLVDRRGGARTRDRLHDALTSQ